MADETDTPPKSFRSELIGALVLWPVFAAVIAFAAESSDGDAGWMPWYVALAYERSGTAGIFFLFGLILLLHVAILWFGHQHRAASTRRPAPRKPKEFLHEEVGPDGRVHQVKAGTFELSTAKLLPEPRPDAPPSAKRFGWADLGEGKVVRRRKPKREDEVVDLSPAIDADR